MAKYEYVDRPPSGGWIMEVHKGPTHKGNIRKNRTPGRYQFFRGSHNAIRPCLEETDIETLKKGIEEMDL
jgi:hypothetical protein